MLHKRRIGDVLPADENIHRHVVVESGRANVIGDSHPTKVLHRSGVAPFHLWQFAELGALLGYQDVNALLAELDRQSEAYRPRPSD